MMPPADVPDVLIVGGGLAGLTAAWRLSSAGKRVVLLEARRKLGGRAASFIDPESGESIDHCQHVAMGCCTEFLGFVKELGLSHLFTVADKLCFIDERGRQSMFRPNRWPPPLHLLPAFWGLKHLTLREKWRIARAVRRLAGESMTSANFADWLRTAAQTERMIERFWQPVLVSALSESLDRIDIQHARKVFVDGFLSGRDSWKLHIPNVPLRTIYAEIQRRLEALGVVVRLESRVAEICEEKNDELRTLRMTTGETLSAPNVVLAVPCWNVPALLPFSWRGATEVKALNQIETAPITSVHLWYDQPITELPHCVLTSRVSQWLFRRPGPSPSPPLENRDRMESQLRGRGSIEATSCLYQVVISNSRDLLDRPAPEIAAIVEQELRDTFPAARESKLIRSKVVTEHRAVFSPTPGIESLRPSQRTPWPGVYWCGDWTATGWPSTMESAVLSGLLAAAEVMKH